MNAKAKPKAKSNDLTRRLLSIHRIAGLIVAINLLLVTVTGLILIFHHEIEHLLGNEPEATAGEVLLPVADMIALAQAEHPALHPISIFQDPEEHPGVLYVGLSPDRSFDDSVFVALDRVAGKVIPAPDFDDTFIGIVFLLHAQLLAGPIGGYLVGLVGLVFLVSLVTGFLVYGPMMRRFSFGTLRTEKQRRTLYADVHKWLGAATFGWNFVVAFTGVLLTLGGPLLQLYATTELAEAGAPFAGEPLVTDLSTVDAALAEADSRDPDKEWSFAALPGSPLGTPRHYGVFLEGGEGLESRTFTVALADAVQPTEVELRSLPWYLQALLLSEPLHFGDYGGWPLKIIWAAFSLITIAMSVSGIYVYFAARKRRAQQPEESPAELAPEASA